MCLFIAVDFGSSKRIFYINDIRINRNIRLSIDKQIVEHKVTTGVKKNPGVVSEID